VLSSRIGMRMNSIDFTLDYANCEFVFDKLYFVTLCDINTQNMIKDQHMDDLQQLLTTLEKNKWLIAVKKNPDWVRYLQNRYTFTTSLKEMIFLFERNLNARPVCKVDNCLKEVNWINNTHYSITCGHICSQQLRKQLNQLEEIHTKIKKTLQERYGVTSPSMNPDVIAKRNQTLMNRYGALVSPHAREIRKQNAKILNEKGKQTLKERYGVISPTQIPGIIEKQKQTLQRNYGVSHTSLIPHVQQARLEKKLAKYNNLAAGVATILSWNTADQTLVDLYENPNSRITFKCDACDNIEELATETFKWRTNTTGTPCIKCSRINKGSVQEQNVCKFIQSLGVNVIRNDRLQIHPFELDMWIPEQNLAVEYCGLYWHSELRGVPKNYHLNKMIACSQKGIRLITIFEDEWIHKPEIVKNRLQSILGKSTHKVGARQLDSVKISNKLANRFCEKYHIQGVGRTNYAYGLTHQGELISVMTFSKLNPAKGSTHQEGIWELNRYCSIGAWQIPGGASKLFAAFVRDTDPLQIISYSDKRWNTGQVYEKLNFKKLKDSALGYWYIDLKNTKRIHRYSLRKTTTDNSQLTEWENRKLQGYNRIWDCGHTKWIWNKKAE
jgi:hypothetical protein